MISWPKFNIIGVPNPTLCKTQCRTLCRVRHPDDIDFWPWYHMILTFKITTWAYYQYHAEKNIKKQGSAQGSAQGLIIWRVRHNFSPTYWTWYPMISSFKITIWPCLWYHAIKKGFGMGSARVRHGLGTVLWWNVQNVPNPPMILIFGHDITFF